MNKVIKTAQIFVMILEHTVKVIFEYHLTLKSLAGSRARKGADSGRVDCLVMSYFLNNLSFRASARVKKSIIIGSVE